MHPWPRFLFWYLTLLSLVAAGLLVLLCAFVYAIPSLPFVDLAMLTAVPLWTYFICFCVSIILCVGCARAHQIGFWRGILGWFFGFTLLVLMIYVPLVAFFASTALKPMLFYVVLLAVSVALVVRQRRLTSKRQREVFQAFD